jgi:Kdo2-lipid IVA lauroyltransferase/acyltransferase
LLDLIASLLVRGLNRIFHVTPMRFNLWLGRRVGELVYLLSGKRKMVTYANLKAAFCGKKTPEEIRKTAKAVYANMVQSFAEIVSMTRFDDEYVKKHITVRDIEIVEKLSKTGKGIIFLSAHFGNWELNSSISAVEGYPLYFLGREQKMKRLYELMNRLRETRGNVVIRKGTDVKRIIRVLHQGKMVGMAGDQNAGANGELLPVFGRLASTAIGPFRIAERTGAQILPAFIHRVEGPYHELVLGAPMDIKKGDDVIPYMEKYNRLIEKHVSDYPSQWLWMHKRWKMNPSRRIMVLDDGKKGHLKQSMAVVKQIKNYRQSQGHPPEYIQDVIVRIIFKSKVRKFILNALTPFYSSNLQGRPGILRWALDGKSYRDAVDSYADIIISCGSGLFGVNRILKIENYARSVAVLDPGPMSRGKFDLVVIPEHDIRKRAKGKKDNVIVTELAPNLIHPQELLSLRKEMETKYPPLGKLNIGLLMGGDNPQYVFTESLSRELSAAVLEACEKSDGYLYVTTSRRTSPSCEKIIKDSLSLHERCRMMVSGRDDNDPHTVEKILALSDLLIVSGESISMVSEAVSSARPVLVFMPEKKAARVTKYERFVETLGKRGHLRVVRPEEMPKEVLCIAREKTPPLVSDDAAIIREKLYKLF